MWSPPLISLKWGEYFAPDADDDAKEVTTALSAHDGGIITLRCAVEKVQRAFKIENVDQFIAALEEEAAEKQAKLADAMHAMAAVGADPEAPAPQPGKPKLAKPPPAKPPVDKPKPKVDE